MKQVGALFPGKTYSMPLAHSDLVIFGILAEACGVGNTRYTSHYRHAPIHTVAKIIS